MHPPRNVRWRGILTPLLLAIAAGAGFAGNADIVPDGRINNSDVALALRFAGGLVQPTAVEAADGDVAGGAGVNLLDAVRIVRVAAGIDPPIGGLSAVALPVTVSVNVPGNTTQDLSLAGGYGVRGTLLDTSGRPVLGNVALTNLSTLVSYSSAVSPSDGSFAVNVPPGTYQAYAQYAATDTGSNGEPVRRAVSTVVGTQFTVSANVANLHLVRQDTKVPPNITISFTGAGIPSFSPESLRLRESPSGGNTVSTTLSGSAADTFPVQNAAYIITADGSYAVTAGSVEDLTIAYGTALSVTGSAVSRALNVPALRTFSGAVTLPAGLTATVADVGYFPLGTSGDLYSALAGVTGVGHYDLAAPAGSYDFYVVLQLADHRTIYWIQPLTVTSTSPATLNVTLPALPASVTLSGRVTGLTGAALPNAAVQVAHVNTNIPAGGQYVLNAAATANASGVYTVSLLPGTYTVTATPAS